jgi:hypothetical protein
MGQVGLTRQCHRFIVQERPHMHPRTHARTRNHMNDGKRNRRRWLVDRSPCQNKRYACMIRG